MKVEFEKVISGLSRYINNNNLYENMNDWQELIARMAVGRIMTNEENIKKSLVDNPFIRTFDIMDASGMVDVDSLASDLKREISRKEKLTLSVPIIGKLTFTPADVDCLRQCIMADEGVETYEVN